MTADSTERRAQRVRHPLKFRLLRVARVQDLAPQMRRVTFADESLADFVSASFDDHVKLFFPLPGQSQPTLPTVTEQGMVFPEGEPRPPARDYTPRRVDTVARELDVDFVLHGDGPASTWAAQAAPGQVLGAGGPRGSFVIPADYPWHVLIGDDTALPAIGRRLEELAEDARVFVRIEVDDAAARIALPQRAAADVGWVYRSEGDDVLLAAARALAPPPGAGYVWIAAEAAKARALRALVVGQWGVDKVNVRAAAYWKRGASSVHENLDG